MFKTRTFLVLIALFGAEKGWNIQQVPFNVHVGNSPQLSLNEGDISKIKEVMNCRLGLPTGTNWMILQIIPLQDESSENN